MTYHADKAQARRAAKHWAENLAAAGDWGVMRELVRAFQIAWLRNPTPEMRAVYEIYRSAWMARP